MRGTYSAKLKSTGRKVTYMKRIFTLALALTFALGTTVAFADDHKKKDDHKKDDHKKEEKKKGH